MKLKIIIVTLLSLSFLSCTHIHRESSDMLPREAFLHIRKTLTVVKCEGSGDKTSGGAPTCRMREFNSAASGFIVKVDNDGAYAITAAHVCEDDVPPDMESPTTKVSATYVMRRLDGEAYSASVLTYDREIDVCLVYVKGLTEGIEAVKISPTKPEPGDHIYNIAAPIAIFRPNMVPVLEGRYNGETKGLAWYTLPAAPGSSGSMIVNENGELIGLVHSVFVRFPVITLATTHGDLVDFIRKNVSKYVVYKNVMDVLDLKNVFES